MSAALDRWLTRFYHAVGGSLFLAACACVSYAAGDWHRPDRLRPAERPTPQVPPGIAWRRPRVVVDDAACAPHRTRRLQSARRDGCRAMPPGIGLDAPAFDRDGEPRTIGIEFPAAVPCGLTGRPFPPTARAP